MAGTVEIEKDGCILRLTVTHAHLSSLPPILSISLSRSFSLSMFLSRLGVRVIVAAGAARRPSRVRCSMIRQEVVGANVREEGLQRKPRLKRCSQSSSQSGDSID